MSNILILDLSYIIFYRYNALLSWYKRAYPNKEIDNKIISEKYNKLFIKCIEQLIKKHNSKYQQVFFCQDCDRSSNWRFKIYSDYKNNRTYDEYIFDYFKNTINNLIPYFVSLGCYQLSINKVEADDIAYFITKKFLTETNKNIIIITNDYDYIQMIQDRVKIYNLKDLDLSTKIQQSPEIDLKMKIILGDKSDNIPSIFKRCGKSTALKYAINQDLLEEKMKQDQELRKKYNLNKLLIDLSEIPNEFEKDINSNLNIVNKLS